MKIFLNFLYTSTNCKLPCPLKLEIGMRQLLAFHQEVTIQRNYVKPDLGINVEIPLCSYRLNKETISYHCLENENGYLLAA